MAGGGFGGRRRAGGLAAMRDQPDEGLPKIAAATGGGYFELTSTNDLAATFARVADELHHQYALGFTPSTLDGKMHALEVRVRGRRDEGPRPQELLRAPLMFLGHFGLGFGAKTAVAARVARRAVHGGAVRRSALADAGAARHRTRRGRSRASRP